MSNNYFDEPRELDDIDLAFLEMAKIMKQSKTQNELSEKDMAEKEELPTAVPEHVCEDEDGTKEVADTHTIEEIPHTKPQKSSDKNGSMGSFVTKKEGLLMFVIAILVISVCFLNLQHAVMTDNHDLIERTKNLEIMMGDMRLYIAELEEKLDGLKYELNDDPIHITIQIDGVDKDFIYDPDTGDVTESTPSDTEFDTTACLGVAFYEGNDGSNNPIGLQVDYVYPYSPAEFAGLRAGDIIMSINGATIDTLDDLTNVMAQFSANETIEIQLATTSASGVNIVTTNATLTYRGNFDLGEN